MRFLQYELERWKACYLLWSDAGPIWRQPCMLQIHFALCTLHHIVSFKTCCVFWLGYALFLFESNCVMLFESNRVYLLVREKTANTISLWDEQCRFWRNATECLKGLLPIEMEWFSQECCVLWMKVPAEESCFCDWNCVFKIMLQSRKYQFMWRCIAFIWIMSFAFLQNTLQNTAFF